MLETMRHTHSKQDRSNSTRKIILANANEAVVSTGCFKKLVACLCGSSDSSGGAGDSIISVFTQLHRSGFKQVFQTLYESI